VRLASLTLLLTGLRNAEGRLLAVPMVNLKKRVITVPRSLMKVTDPGRGDFEIPMSDELLEVMKLAVQRAKANDCLLLFPAERDSSKAVTNEAVEKAFREHTDRQHSPHGTRKSLKSFALEELEQPEHIARTLLDHKPFDDVSAHYNAAKFLKQRRTILAEWAGVIANGGA
jgi:integrase